MGYVYCKSQFDFSAKTDTERERKRKKKIDIEENVAEKKSLPFKRKLCFFIHSLCQKSDISIRVPSA